MSAASVDGLRCLRGSHTVPATMERVAASVTARGLTVFARVDHGAGAADAGMALRPTELIVFGAARGGTPLMQAAQTAGIDLPLKILVWEDEDGATWVGYNDPAWIARRHGLTPDRLPAIHAMSAMLAGIAAEASEASQAPG